MDTKNIGKTTVLSGENDKCQVRDGWCPQTLKSVLGRMLISQTDILLANRTDVDLPLALLAELIPWMYDDTLRLPLLTSCLADGDADKITLHNVLNSFADDSHHSLLPEERFRKIPRTDELWELAELLSDAGLIQPPKMGSGRDERKMVITPVRSEYEAEGDPQE